MNYISLDIRMGLAGSSRIRSHRIRFHEKTIQLLFSGISELYRLGPTHTSPFDYQRINDEPEYIMAIVQRALKDSLRGKHDHVEFLLFDFSTSPFDLLRDPILYNLAEVIEEICSRRICTNFILLLPELPGLEAVSIERIFRTKENFEEFKLIMFSNSGDYYTLPEDPQARNAKNQYRKLISEIQENPLTRLEGKVVRRLGHFKRSKNIDGCRHYSYLTDNCEVELLELINNWWANKCLECDAILYDTKSSHSLTGAVKAFAESKEIAFYRIEDVMGDNSKALEVARKESCLIVLDVVETGGTLKEYGNKLRGLNIKLSDHVLTVINKGGNKETRIDEYKVTSFLAKEREPVIENCPQCDIGLPHTSDEGESLFPIRAYDFWYMAEQVGWGKEKEVPDNIGYSYEIVPKFPEMLDAYGDWIAYKMERLYKLLSYPENIFAIHPDEPGANAVSDRLRIRFNQQLSIVKIPRSAIRTAQALNNSWEEAFRDIGRPEWVKQLESLSQASAMITDIFNASGSTYNTIYQLLIFFNIQVFCYFPFVDRDCDPSSEGKYMGNKYSLYKWYGPRQLKRRGGRQLGR